jgi:hypothetical protein
LIHSSQTPDTTVSTALLANLKVAPVAFRCDWRKVKDKEMGNPGIEECFKCGERTETLSFIQVTRVCPNLKKT